MRRNTTQRDRDRARLRKLGAPCHICGKPIDYALRWPDPMSFVADHVHALVHGGADDMTNKRAAHAACNGAKSDKPHADIIRRSRVLRGEGEVPPTHP